MLLPASTVHPPSSYISGNIRKYYEEEQERLRRKQSQTVLYFHKMSNISPFLNKKYLISPEVIGTSTHLYNGDGVVTSVSLSRWERADIVVLVTGFYEDVVRLVSCAHNS